MVSHLGACSPMDTLTRNFQNSEALPSQSLKPFAGPLGTGKSHNGMRLFSSTQFAMSENFMRENEVSLKSFADVLHSLCVGVFGLKVPSLAIYHDPAGTTIAFNRGKALHFNLRFFHALHFLANKQETRECYSYWFVVICHELAHNLVHGHNKEHGTLHHTLLCRSLVRLTHALLYVRLLHGELCHEILAQTLVRPSFSSGVDLGCPHLLHEGSSPL